MRGMVWLVVSFLVFNSALVCAATFPSVPEHVKVYFLSNSGQEAAFSLNETLNCDVGGKEFLSQLFENENENDMVRIMDPALCQKAKETSLDTRIGQSFSSVKKQYQELLLSGKVKVGCHSSTDKKEKQVVCLYQYKKEKRNLLEDSVLEFDKTQLLLEGDWKIAPVTFTEEKGMEILIAVTSGNIRGYARSGMRPTIENHDYATQKKPDGTLIIKVPGTKTKKRGSLQNVELNVGIIALQTSTFKATLNTDPVDPPPAESEDEGGTPIVAIILPIVVVVLFLIAVAVVVVIRRQSEDDYGGEYKGDPSTVADSGQQQGQGLSGRLRNATRMFSQPKKMDIEGEVFGAERKDTRAPNLAVEQEMAAYVQRDEEYVNYDQYEQQQQQQEQVEETPRRMRSLRTFEPHKPHHQLYE